MSFPLVKGRILLLAALLLAAAGVARASKLNARLRMERESAKTGFRVAGVAAAAGKFRVLVRVAPGITLAQMRSAYPGVTFGSASGVIMTAEADDAALAAFDVDPTVVSVEAARKLHPTLDVVRSNDVSGGGLYLGVTRNAAATDLANATGQGVVVGVVDTGIDFHHLDFIDPISGHSRVQYIWDQTDAVGPAPTGVTCPGSNCGTEWTNSQINASIPSGGSVREVDSGGHGTHVTGIAAGNGQAGTPGTFVGMAPKADIIFVKTDFSNAGILDGLSYIAARAGALGERAVINLSLGGQIDPHDGTSNFDVGVAAVAASTPVVVAMGNDGTGEAGTFPHANVPSMSNGGSVAVNVTAFAGSPVAEIDLWTGSPSVASVAKYTVTLTVNGSQCATVVDGANANGSACSAGGTSYTVYVYNNSSFVGFAGGDTTTTNDREIYVAVVNNFGFPINLPITVSLTCTNAGGCGTLDGFVDPQGEGVNFAAGSGYTRPSTLTMASPATANNVFSVASYASKVSWTAKDSITYSYTDGQTLGTLSLFSGQGPTRDGRQKPDVAAPGEGIGSSLSAQTPVCSTCEFDTSTVLPDLKHGILQGTSMATPVVTGILATRLQGAPGRSTAQLRTLLQGLARSDAAAIATGALPNTAFGYGKVVASPQPGSAPSSATATTLGVSSITWTWNAALLSADAFNVYYATDTSQALALNVQPPLILTGLTSNTTLSLEIRGVGGGIEGPGAVVATATYAAAPAAAPTAAAFSSSVTVSFPLCSAPPAFAACSGYRVQVSSVSDFSGVLFSSAVFSRLQGSLTVVGLAGNTGYFVRYGALNPLGAASYGPFTTINTGTNVFAPTNPDFPLVGTGSILLNWSIGANPPGLTYVAQASTSPTFAADVFTYTTVGGSAIFSGGLLANSTYYVRVQAVGGPYLSTATVTLVMPPAFANGFSGVTTSSLTVSWVGFTNPSDTLYLAELSTTSNLTAVTASTQTYATNAGFKGLTANTVYYARVHAIARNGTPSSPTSIIQTATLVPPPTLSAQPFSAQIQRGFTISYGSGGNPPGTQYMVQLASDAALSTVLGGSVTYNNFASFILLQPNFNYFVRVSALNQLGGLSPAPVVSTATLADAPYNVLLATNTSTSVSVSWNRNGLPIGTAFVAQVSSSPLFDGAVLSSTTQNAAAVVFGLLANTTYYSRVQSLSSYPPNPDSAFAAGPSLATLAAAVSAAATPLSGVSSTTVTVAWNPLPASPQDATAEGYRLEASLASDFSSVAASSVTAFGASGATFSGLASGQLYYFRVASLNWQGAANYTSFGSTTTLIPALASGTVTSSGATLVLPGSDPALISIQVVVGPGTFPVGTHLMLLSGSSFPLLSARSNESTLLTPFGPGAGFDLSAGGLQPAIPVKVVVRFDSNADPAGQDERKLNLWRYDVPAGQWTLTPSAVDTRAHTLTASLNHFSNFAPFFTAAGTDVSAISVFPQPWEVGDASSRYAAAALQFSGAPAGARIRLFTVTGELIYETSATVGGVATWDGNTRFGKKAASGTYVTVIEAGGQKVVRRVVIIR
jgi:hypothetical protein